MKKAEDYIDEFKLHDVYIPYNEKSPIHDPECNFCYYEDKIKELIKQAQIDAIEEACKVCAENTRIKFNYKSITSTTTAPSDIASAYINKQSILNCAETLKKQL